MIHMIRLIQGFSMARLLLDEGWYDDRNPSWQILHSSINLWESCCKTKTVHGWDWNADSFGFGEESRPVVRSISASQHFVFREIKNTSFILSCVSRSLCEPRHWETSQRQRMTTQLSSGRRIQLKTDLNMKDTRYLSEPRKIWSNAWISPNVPLQTRYRTLIPQKPTSW